MHYREVLEGMMKMGEMSARLKQVEVALDAAENSRQNAETESALTKEKVELLKSELKRTELLVSLYYYTHQWNEIQPCISVI